MIRTPAPLFALLAATVLAGCQEAPQLRVSEAWVRLAPTPDRPSAAYFTIQGGEAEARLVDVTSSVAVRTELHGMSHEGGVMRMQRIEGGAVVPAGGELRFAPGGKHVMIYHINPGINPGRAVPLRFSFEDGTRLEFNAASIAANAPPPEQR